MEEVCKVCGSDGPLNNGRCDDCNECDAYRLGTRIIARRRTEDQCDDDRLREEKEEG